MDLCHQAVTLAMSSVNQRSETDWIKNDNQEVNDLGWLGQWQIPESSGDAPIKTNK